MNKQTNLYDIVKILCEYFGNRKSQIEGVLTTDPGFCMSEIPNCLSV